ncbi:MAG: hypothetical protein AMJ59_27855 [Gammaproteobacteria bacterium SG8_31]|jgi:hypothetical protein|nr:MAG: hypothetical protein AMJ59_27855 [Gammaproteobacteria bacterium SG8_31]
MHKIDMSRTQRRPGLHAGLCLFLITTWLAGPVAQAQESEARALADRMLNALGGRATWAQLRNTINGSQQNRAEEPTVVYTVITMDFERPRFRIETTARDLHLVRVVDGDRSWRLSRVGRIEDLPAERFKEDMQWYASHLYRSIHRIAAGDAALSLGLADDGRLEIFEKGRRILWFRLDAKGEPYAFGTYDDEIGSLSGPWDFVKDGIHHPRWISNADGTWRASVRALDVNVPLHSAMFARPLSE